MIRFIIFDCKKQLNRKSYLFLDIEDEQILLAKTENVSLAQLPSLVPNDSARYHLYNFKHTHEGDYMESAGKHYY